jgi:hypothetical protein
VAHGCWPRPSQSPTRAPGGEPTRGRPPRRTRRTTPRPDRPTRRTPRLLLLQLPWEEANRCHNPCAAAPTRSIGSFSQAAMEPMDVDDDATIHEGGGGDERADLNVVHDGLLRYRTLVKGVPTGESKSAPHAVLKTTARNPIEDNRDHVKVLTSPQTLRVLLSNHTVTKRNEDSDVSKNAPKLFDAFQVHLGKTCSTANAANVDIEVARTADGKLVTDEIYDTLTDEQISKLTYHPMPFGLGGELVLGQLPDVESIWLEQCANLNSILRIAAPEHYADMQNASLPVDITVPEQVLSDLRKQLGHNHTKHLQRVGDTTTHRLDVRIRAGLENPGVLTNGTINLQKLLKAAFEEGVDLLELIATNVHGDGEDFKPFGRFKTGGASITSPFYSTDKLTGGQFVGYADSVQLSDKRETPVRHTTIGTLYAFAHEVRSALLERAIDPSTLTREELEDLLRGSFVRAQRSDPRE